VRDLKDLYDFEPGKQDWAASMACLLIEARDAARDARRDGKAALDAAVMEDLVARYRELAASGLAANVYRGTVTARDACRIARRFMKYEDMILRFATRPDLDIFTNNDTHSTLSPRPLQQPRLDTTQPRTGWITRHGGSTGHGSGPWIS
jgi:transposase